MKPWKKKQPLTPAQNLVTVMTIPGGNTGTNYYLHDPNFAESVHIGKTAATGGGRLTWYTDVALAHGHWNDTESLVSYLRYLEVDSFVTGADGTARYIAWVASEYGDVCMPGKMAENILRCHDHQTADGTFS